jgi:simple sugar transport system ATP-binding protein
MFGGEPAPRLADRDAWRQRVACVYQKSTIIPGLTVAENLFLNRHDRGRGGLISWRAVRGRARALLRTWSVDVDVRTPAGELGVEQRQFVEVARALSFGARFIILDEPTAQLDSAAIDRLFARIRDLGRQGVTFLFISHHLQEIYEICDTVTVFRDAQHILTAPVAELPRPELVAAMTGEGVTEATRARRRPADTASPDVLVVEGATVRGAYEDVSVRIRAGEIVGLAGAASSGRIEVAETVVGLRAADRGSVTIGGVRPRPGRVPAALKAGAGFVPQDRHRQGFVPEMSLADNGTLTIPERLGPPGFIDGRRRDAFARSMIENLAIKTPGPELPVSGLSGGNQQKVVMARAMANDPKALVLINPTAGVDVQAKTSIYATIDQLKQRGQSVLVVTSDDGDLEICDRILVMFEGRVVTELHPPFSEKVLAAAVQGAVDTVRPEPGTRPLSGQGAPS